MLADPMVYSTVFVQDTDTTGVIYPLEACLVEGTPIQTPVGPRPIETLVAGDLVLDKHGQATHVEAAWCEGRPSELLEIKFTGGKKLRITPDHRLPVWAWPRDCACGCGTAIPAGRSYAPNHATPSIVLARWHPERGPMIVPTAARMTIGRDQSKGLPPGYQPIREMVAGAVKPGDYLMIPRTFTEQTPEYPVEFARLLGYYLAEGDLTNRGAIRLSFNSSEYDTWANDAAEMGGRLGMLPWRRLYEEDHQSIVFLTGRTLAAALVEHGGRYSATKVMSADVMGWPLDHKAEVIRGLFRGDGWRAYNGHTFTVEHVTTSAALASQVELLLAQLGYVSSTSPRDPERGRQATYHVRLTAQSARGLARLVWGDDVAPAGVSSRVSQWMDESYVYLQVKGVELVENDAPVYNLRVAGDHSYLAANLGVFNCDAPEALAYSISGLAVSAFVTPAWFVPGSKGPWSYPANAVSGPLRLRTGGYIGVFTVLQGSGWGSRTASLPPTLARLPSRRRVLLISEVAEAS
jgi:hypothetical protein